MKKLLAALAGTAALIASNAFAADAPMLAQKDWFVKLGATYVMPSSDGTVNVAFPVAVVNRQVTVGNAWSGSLEAGRYINDRFSLSLTVGIPPTHDVMVAGNKVGTVTLGAAAVDAQFHLLDRSSPIDLYVGGGLAYNAYFSNTVPGMKNVDGGLAPVIQAGVEYKVSDTWGLFVDAKKEFFTTTVHSNFPDYKERLDPLAVTAGVAFHF